MECKVYLELSQGNKSNPFLVVETYNYGKEGEFKTLNQAIKQAQKDFKREAKHFLNETLNYIGTRHAIRVVQKINDGLLIHNQIEINS